VIAVLVVVAVFFAGTWMGRHQAESGAWHSGRGQVGIREVSIDYHGWTYGVSGSVPTWRDAAGTWRDDGWPSCLRPVGHSLEVRFQARTVTVEGTTWRPIVAIDCQGTDAS
jgi:hypothetical protein